MYSPGIRLSVIFANIQKVCTFPVGYKLRVPTSFLNRYLSDFVLGWELCTILHEKQRKVVENQINGSATGDSDRNYTELSVHKLWNVEF